MNRIILLIPLAVFLLAVSAVYIVKNSGKEKLVIELNNELSESCMEKTGCEGDIPCMANPASKFCECMGGKIEIKDTETGQIGYCLINGKEIEEWEYFKSFK